MTGRQPKCSDIDTPTLLARIGQLSRTRLRGAGWVFCWDIEPWYPEYPDRLVAAKLRGLLRRGLLDGCGCGCRGDYTVTETGWSVVAAAPAGPPPPPFGPFGSYLHQPGPPIGL